MTSYKELGLVNTKELFKKAVSALDVSVGAQILNLFRDLHDQLGLGMVFIGHNLNQVYYLCDRIAVMRDGRILEQGTAEEIYTKPQHEYTKVLLKAGTNEHAAY
ncbi:hypothetical protein AGMMS49579_00460 [Spirochaetia bacterium]|nr:hypothetical protein AGMMS49579_00430 [Spirochaetia bacterium]GHV49289.1 hypothetical protein AGMMS49579_00460 [Spirochaetia bacterium]